MAAPLAAASRCLRVATGASAAVATLLRRYGNFDIALRLFRTDFSASRRPACDALSRCAYFPRADWCLQSNGSPIHVVRPLASSKGSPTRGTQSKSTSSPATSTFLLLLQRFWISFRASLIPPPAHASDVLYFAPMRIECVLVLVIRCCARLTSLLTWA